MEKRINVVIKGQLGPGEILSKIGKNKTGEPAIIFYSQKKPPGWFDQLKLDAKKFFGTIRSGTAVATEYSKALSAAVPDRLKGIKEGKAPLSFSTPDALRIYLNSMKAGSYTLEDTKLPTTVTIEIETVSPLDDTFGTTLLSDKDRKIFGSMKSPNNASKYSPYPSHHQLPNSSTNAAPEITATVEKEKLPGT